MSDEALVWQVGLGAGSLQGDTATQVLWLATLAVCAAWSLAATRERARSLFVPGATP